MNTRRLIDNQPSANYGTIPSSPAANSSSPVTQRSASAALKHSFTQCFSQLASLLSACCGSSQEVQEPGRSLQQNCGIATRGWTGPDTSFSWQTIDTANLQRAKTNILENGIKPMLREVLGEGFNNPALQARLSILEGTEPKVFSKEEFALRSFYCDSLEKPASDAITKPLAEIKQAVIQHLADNDANLGYLLRPKNDETFVNVLKKVKDGKIKMSGDIQTLAILFFKTEPTSTEERGLKIEALKNNILLDVMKESSTIQGKAFGDTVVINRDSAESSVGLHLLTHEMMHTLADKNTVASLTDSGKILLADEGPNEFFARLGSLFVGLDQTTSTEKTPYKLTQDWAHDETTRTIAKSYFLGDAVALETLQRTLPSQ